MDITVEELLSIISKSTSPIMRNEKTYRSVDFTTICPKLLAGNACKYCYVQNARKKNWNAKKYHTRIRYNGEILRMEQSTIEKMNAMGGIRLFSFADYYSWMDEDLKAFFEDCQKVGLLVKAITKQPQFIYKFAQYCHIIHVSVDNIGDGIDWELAKNLRKIYPNVLIRSVITRENDFQCLEWTDILTLNHGQNGFHNFTSKQRKFYADKYTGKVCCETGHCETCQIRCGEDKLR